MGKSSKQWTIKCQEREIKTLKDKVSSMEAGFRLMLQELTELGQGVGTKPSWYNSLSHSWDECMKHKAILAIKKVALLGVKL